jgi:hypothetical protein
LDATLLAVALKTFHRCVSPHHDTGAPPI